MTTQNTIQKCPITVATYLDLSPKIAAGTVLDALIAVREGMIESFDFVYHGVSTTAKVGGTGEIMLDIAIHELKKRLGEDAFRVATPWPVMGRPFVQVSVPCTDFTGAKALQLLLDRGAFNVKVTPEVIKASVLTGDFFGFAEALVRVTGRGEYMAQFGGYVAAF